MDSTDGLGHGCNTPGPAQRRQGWAAGIPFTSAFPSRRFPLLMDLFPQRRTASLQLGFHNAADSGAVGQEDPTRSPQPPSPSPALRAPSPASDSPQTTTVCLPANPSQVTSRQRCTLTFLRAALTPPAPRRLRRAPNRGRSPPAPLPRRAGSRPALPGSSPRQSSRSEVKSLMYYYKAKKKKPRILPYKSS